MKVYIKTILQSDRSKSYDVVVEDGDSTVSFACPDEDHAEALIVSMHVHTIEFN